MMAEPLILGRPSDRNLNEQLLRTAWTRRGTPFRLAFAVAGSIAVVPIEPADKGPPPTGSQKK